MLAKSEHRGGGDSGWFRRASKPLRATKNMLRGPLAVVKEHRRAYLLLNLAYYGLMVGAMAYAAFHPALQRSLLDAMGKAVGSGPMETIAGAYGGGHLLLAVPYLRGEPRRRQLRLHRFAFAYRTLQRAFAGGVSGAALGPDVLAYRGDGCWLLLAFAYDSLRRAGLRPGHAGGLRAGRGVPASPECGLENPRAGATGKG